MGGRGGKPKGGKGGNVGKGGILNGGELGCRFAATCGTVAAMTRMAKRATNAVGFMEAMLLRL